MGNYSVQWAFLQSLGGESGKMKSEMKRRLGAGMMILVILVVGLVGLSWSLRNKRDQNSKPTVTNAEQIVPSKKANLDNWALAYVKDGDIYVADEKGNSQKIVDGESEEMAKPEKLYMKMSDDKRRLAYIGLSGGLDSALKIIDIGQRQKVGQVVYGSSEVVDFDWAPEGNKLVVAVNLKNEEMNYRSYLDLVEVETIPTTTPLFKQENIEITQVEWPIGNYIYYTRIAYGQEKNMAIVKLDFQAKTRSPTVLRSFGGDEIKDYTIGFITSDNRGEIMAFTKAKEAERTRDEGVNGVTFVLPDLNFPSKTIKYGPDNKTRWYGDYLVGIERPYGSPDSSVVLVDLAQKGKRINLLDMGPSGSFWDVKLVETSEGRMLLVWSEFDQLNSIKAYDLLELEEARERSDAGMPRWTLEGAKSFDQ